MSAEIRRSGSARLTPNDAAILRLIAHALSRQGQFESAAAAWQDLLAVIPDDAEATQAVLDRDLSHDGAFVYGVASTRIYCRPSCPARTPLRRNVRFYPSAAAAQGAGFRACRSRRPSCFASPTTRRCWRTATGSPSPLTALATSSIAQRSLPRSLGRAKSVSIRRLRLSPATSDRSGVSRTLTLTFALSRLTRVMSSS